MGDARRQLGRVTAGRGRGDQRRRPVPDRGGAELRGAAADPRRAGLPLHEWLPKRHPPIEIPDQLDRGHQGSVARRAPADCQSTQGMPLVAVTAPPWGPVVGITTEGERGAAWVLAAGLGACGTVALTPSRICTW